MFLNFTSVLNTRKIQGVLYEFTTETQYCVRNSVYKKHGIPRNDTEFRVSIVTSSQNYVFRGIPKCHFCKRSILYFGEFLKLVTFLKIFK
jgi:hypothetical protein